MTASLWNLEFFVTATELSSLVQIEKTFFCVSRQDRYTQIEEWLYQNDFQGRVSVEVYNPEYTKSKPVQTLIMNI